MTPRLVDLHAGIEDLAEVLTTLGIAAVRVAAGGTLRPEDVANAAALAKRQTEHLGVGLYLLDPPLVAAAA